jgi:pantothenate kinase type III
MAIKKKKARAVLLALDVGNTMTKLGLFSGKKLLTDFQLASNRERTADELGLFMKDAAFGLAQAHPCYHQFRRAPS